MASGKGGHARIVQSTEQLAVLSPGLSRWSMDDGWAVLA